MFALLISCSISNMKTCYSYKIVAKTIELNFSPCIVNDIGYLGTSRWHTGFSRKRH